MRWIDGARGLNGETNKLAESNKEEDRMIPRARWRKRRREEGGRSGRNNGSRDSYPEENQGWKTQSPGLFEARRRSSSQPTVCTVKVARIDRTAAGLSSATSIDADYFRHRIIHRFAPATAFKSRAR